MAEYRIEVVVSAQRAIASAAAFGTAMETLEKRANKTRDSIRAALRPPPAADLGSIAAPFLRASGASEHFAQVVLDTSRKARGSVDDAAISWDGWTSKTNAAGVTVAKTGGLIRGAMAAAPYVAAAAAVASLADSYTNLQNRLISVTSSEGEARDLSEDLFGVAQRTRSEWGAVTEVFVRTSGALKGMGYSQREVIEFTETLSKSVKMSGASAETANAAMIQLSQGMASGTLRGDELNSILEGLPTVADVIAQQFGVTRGELRKLGEEGKISADDIIAAFASAKGDIDAGFGRTVPTIGEQFTKLKNILVKAVGDMMPLLGPMIEALGTLISVAGEVLGALGKVAGVIAETAGEIGSSLGLIDDSLTAADARRLAKEFEDVTVLGIDMSDMIDGAADKTDAMNESFRLAAEGGDEVAQAFHNATFAVDLYGKALDVLRGREQEVRDINELLAGGGGVVAASMAAAAAEQARKIRDDLIALKKAQEEAARAMDAAKAAYKSLYEAQNPIAAANNEIAFTQQMINKVVGEYPALAAEGALMMSRLRESMEDQLDPLGAYLDGIRQETELLNLTATARRDTIQYMAFENAMRQSGLEITLERVAAFEREIDLLNQAQANSDARDANASALGAGVTDIFGKVDKGFDDRAAANARAEAEAAQEAAKQAEKDFEQSFDGIYRNATDVAGAVASAWTNAFSSMEDALVNFVTTGKLDFHALTQSILADMTRILIKKAMVGIFGRPSAPGVDDGLTPLLFTGGGFPGFATGGSFTVGGNGGTDTTPVMFRATPGERVIVQTPAQQAAAQQPMMSAPPVIHNTVVMNPGQMLQVLQSPGGRRELREAIRVEAGAFKAALR